nr:hypothetical protein 2 [bacterium]
MRCFNHKNIEASAVCYSCGKALCNQCSKIFDEVVVCKNSIFCSEKINLINKTVDHYDNLAERANNTSKFSFLRYLILGFLGLFSVILGFMIYPYSHIAVVPLVLSIFFTLFGLFMIFVSYVLIKNKSY